MNIKNNTKPYYLKLKSMSLNELIKKLETQISKNPTDNMKRVREAIKYFEIDFSNIKKIHVAGTNGKGSTCKYLTQILTDAGYKVGTFVSPYLRVFNERILLNNQNISNDDLEKYLKVVLSYNETLDIKMSFFELLTVMAFLYFKAMEVEVIIIEVGIGGKLDVTNTLTYDLSLLTNVGSDHLEKLGPTEFDVLDNKLGILKPDGHLITTIDSKYIDYSKKYANSVNGKITFLEEAKKISNDPLSFDYNDEVYKLKMVGDYQIKNAQLAITATNILFPSISSNQIKTSLFRANWPGRMELINTSPLIYVDAAHNKEAASALKETIKELFPKRRVVVLMSILRGKDFKGFINELEEVASEIILTSFPDPRLANLLEIKEYFPNLVLIQSFEEALKQLNDKDTVYIVTGSIHFIGYFLQNFQN